MSVLVHCTTLSLGLTCFHSREELIKTGAQLVMRRKQLISELAFIYPIVEVSRGSLGSVLVVVVA